MFVLLVFILIFLVISFLINIVMGVVLVRTRESFDVKLSKVSSEVESLKNELLVRLPPRPYGVDD